jgi:HlyD family secretion protein
MKRITALSLCLAALMLVGCTKDKPVSTPTAAAGSTTPSPTSGSALGGFGMSDQSTPTANPNAKTYTVQRGIIEDMLEFNAKVAPVQIPMSFAQDGIVQKIFVQPGQTIKEGDLIAQLDIADLESQLVEAKLATGQAQQAISQAKLANELEVKQAEIALEAAQQALEQAKAPPSEVVLAQAQAAVSDAQSNLDTVRNNASQAKNQAKADLDKAVTELQSIQQQYGETTAQLQKAEGEEARTLQNKLVELQKQMTTAQTAVDTAVINFNTARNNEVAAVKNAEAKLALAKAQLDDILQGADKFAIAEKERAVRSAEITLEQARQRGQTDPALQSTLENGRLKTKQLEDQIAGRQLHAPISGDIVAINASVGTTITIGSPIITLVDRSRIEIVADSADMVTSERSTAPQLTPSQIVEITFSRYPGKTFSGSVSLAPTTSTNPETGTGSTSGSYHFTFDTQGQSFASGDIASLKILLSRKYDVLYLPPTAIRTTRNKHSVTLRANGTDTSVDIEVGVSTPEKVEILKGLKEGDVVVGA